MNRLSNHDIDRYRNRSRNVSEFYGSVGDDGNGVFDMPSPIDGGNLHVLASDGGGWDHVSVSRVNRCPNWPEMEYVKRLFFRPDDEAKERFCCQCGASLGIVKRRHYDSRDTCGSIQCNRDSRDEREDAHRELDDRMGWS